MHLLSLCSPSMEIRYESTIRYEEFLQRYLERNEPVLIGPEATKGWKVFQRWFAPTGAELDYDYLIAQFGHLRQSTANSATGDCREVALRTVFDDWKRGFGRDDYVRDLHLPLHIRNEGRDVGKELYEVLEICRDDWMNSSSTRDDFRFVVRSFFALCVRVTDGARRSTWAESTQQLSCTKTSVRSSLCSRERKV